MANTRRTHKGRAAASRPSAKKPVKTTRKTTRKPSRRAGATKARDSGRGQPRLLQSYRRLAEISRDLSSTLELPALLNRIVAAASELTESEAASILLIEPRSGELRFEASTHADPQLEGDSLLVPREGSLADWVVTHGEPLSIANVADDPHQFVQLDRWTNRVRRSLLGVPLLARGKIIGALETINKVGDGGFTAEDTETLVTLAAQAAVAIETARLFLQSDLVAEMIHELRTPLASLAATSYMLQRPELAEAQRSEFVRTMQRETARLSQLTNDFLDLARLESGRARLNLEPFSMPELVTECLNLVQPQAQERDIRCGLDLSPETENCPPVVGDRAKIKQVLLNLLTNAIKYNRPHGAITVRAACNGRTFATEVADTGEGIAAVSLPRIFDKFYRVADQPDLPQGTGLGLAIAKKIVETHGGEISAASKPGVGTTLRFTLPLRG